MLVIHYQHSETGPQRTGDPIVISPGPQAHGKQWGCASILVGGLESSIDAHPK